MPRKDTSSTVLGMLSNAGAQTRPADREPETPPAAVAAPQSEPQSDAPQPDPSPTRPVHTLPPAPRTQADSAAPRTMRLRTSTAIELRAAWLEAKREDVLLTAQDFASDLLDEALRRQRRRRTADAS